MIEFLFLDLDDTIFDFHKAERVALSKTIQDFGVEQTVEILTQFLVPRTSAQKRLVSAIVKRRMPLHLGTQRSGNQKLQKQQLNFFT